MLASVKVGLYVKATVAEMAVAVYPLMVQDALMVIDRGDVPQVLIADSAKVTFALTVVVEEPVAEPLFSSS